MDQNRLSTPDYEFWTIHADKFDGGKLEAPKFFFATTVVGMASVAYWLVRYCPNPLGPVLALGVAIMMLAFGVTTIRLHWKRDPNASQHKVEATKHSNQSRRRKTNSRNRTSV